MFDGFRTDGCLQRQDIRYSAKNAESGLTGCFLPLRNGSLFGHMAIALEECATPMPTTTTTTPTGTISPKAATRPKGPSLPAVGNMPTPESDAATCCWRTSTKARSCRVRRSPDEGPGTVPAGSLLLGADHLLLFGTADHRRSGHLQVNQPRAERATIIQFILDELEAVSNPAAHYTSSSDQGRPTAGAAFALGPGPCSSRRALCATPTTTRRPGVQRPTQPMR